MLLLHTLLVKCQLVSVYHGSREGQQNQTVGILCEINELDSDCNTKTGTTIADFQVTSATDSEVRHHVLPAVSSNHHVLLTRPLGMGFFPLRPSRLPLLRD